MKKFTWFLTGIALVMAGALSAQSVTRLLAASPFDDVLRVLDTNNYSTITSKTLAFTNGINYFDGCTGLARNPSTGTFYIVGKDGSDRYLGILDPLTGDITMQGDLFDRFAQITFNSNNTLLGVTGDGGNVSETVFRIDQNNASNTVLTALGNGNDGECICYQPQNNKVYHWSGNGTVVYEKFDTTGANLTNIPVLGGYSGEIFGAVYKTNGKFLTANIDAEFRLVDTLGNFDAPLTTYSANIKGLAYITCPRVITGTLSVCPNGTTALTMSSGGDYYQWYRNNVAVAGGTLATLTASLPGHYNCVINDACGMDSLAAGVNVQLLNMPAVSISGSSTLCAGKTVTLTGSSGGTSQWYLNGVLIQGATSNTYAATQPGVYNMIKTNTNGCKDSAAVGKVLNVIQPTITISGQGQSVCEGTAVTFTASGAVSYTWSTNTNSAVLTVTPSANTTYTLTGADAATCQNTAAVSVTVNAGPSLTLSTSDTEICAGASATLNASGASTYNWTDGPPAPSFVVSPTVTTSYSVTGTASNGCSRTAMITQSVSLCTGFESLTSVEVTFFAYPNPATNVFYLRAEKDMQLTIHNELGQHISTIQLNAANGFLAPVTGLKRGMYFISTTGHQGVPQKVVITD